MRQLTDRSGSVWDVAVGRESYGMQVVLFFPRGGGAICKSALRADTRLEAEIELDGYDDEELLFLLERAVPWESSLFPG